MRHGALGVELWPTKAAALESIGALRGRGINRSREIEAHRVDLRLWWMWALGLPDHFNGVTSLMTSVGGWVPGRLTDAPFSPSVPWSALGRPVLPPVVTHDYRYSCGSTELCDSTGRPVMSAGNYAWGIEPVPLVVARKS